MKRKVIVCDIDGMVLNTQFILDEIHELGLKGEDEWEYFCKNCNSDRVQLMPRIKEYLSGLHSEVGRFFMTARNEKCVEETAKKLESFKIRVDRLYMRIQNDLRPACEIKREHLLQIMEEFDIIAFIDDNLQNCEMAKELGILALRRV